MAVAYGAESLAFLLVGLCKTLDPFDGAGGGPSNSRIATDWTAYSATVFRSKVEPVFMSAVIVRTRDGESDLAAVVFLCSMSGED
ncbi:MAG TPA: hypothetical protein PKH75_14155 [Bacillota bacterium]|nr:hypothetical protein [Bacillota bacterium]